MSAVASYYNHHTPPDNLKGTENNNFRILDIYTIGPFYKRFGSEANELIRNVWHDLASTRQLNLTKYQCYCVL